MCGFGIFCLFVCCFVIKELVDKIPYKMLEFVLLAPVRGMSILDCESDILEN